VVGYYVTGGVEVYRDDDFLGNDLQWVDFSNNMLLEEEGAYTVKLYWSSNDTFIPETTSYFLVEDVTTECELFIDKTDIYLGESVHITGYNGLPGENIYLRINRENSEQHWSISLDGINEIDHNFQPPYPGTYKIFIELNGEIVSVIYTLNVEIEEEKDPFLESFNLVLGLIITIGIASFVTVVAHPYMGVLSFGGCLIVLSQESLGDWQFFPTEVGYILIAFLVIMGILLWFLK